ncbi:TPA: hydrogenase maturation nickel metallochaperone HypA [Legionella pneumophila]|nr:hydrogenase maturation nickel metallochaperone HypA [Legionella pneumophila]
MHELWLCKRIVEIIKQQATGNKCRKVKKVVLEIGQLVAVDKHALNFSFKVITQGTIAQNAKLSIVEIPGEAICDSCQQIVPMKQYYDECLICGNHSLTLTKGEELKVKSMVVE